MAVSRSTNLGLDQPIVLLVIASASGGVVVAFYSVLLILLNRNVLPEQIRLNGWWLPIMAVIAVSSSAYRCTWFTASPSSVRASRGPAILADGGATGMLKQLWLRLLIALVIFTVLTTLAYLLGLLD